MGKMSCSDSRDQQSDDMKGSKEKDCCQALVERLAALGDLVWICLLNALIGLAGLCVCMCDCGVCVKVKAV